MKKIIKIIVLMMISIISIGLVGCGGNNDEIKFNKVINVKKEGADYKATIKGIKEKDGYYTVVIDVENNFKDKAVGIGIFGIRSLVNDSEGLIFDETYNLRHKESGKIVNESGSANLFSSEFKNVNGIDGETVVVSGHENKVIYYPIIPIDLAGIYIGDINSIDELELVYMDHEKGEYIVID